MNTLGTFDIGDLYSLEATDDAEKEVAQFVQATMPPPEKTEGEDSIAETYLPFVKTFNESEGALDTAKNLTGEFVTRIAAPFSAMSAAGLAPIGSTYDPGAGFVERMSQDFTRGGQAFMESFFPGDGDPEQSGYDMVTRVAPGLGESSKRNLGMIAEMMSDPSMVLGLSALKTVSKGMQIAQTQNRLGGTSSMLADGVTEMLTFGKQIDSVQAAAVVDLAKMGDAGNTKAIQEMDRIFRNDTRYAQAALAMEDADVASGVATLDKVMGGKVTGSTFTPVTVPEPGDITRTLDTNVQTKALNTNLARINTEDDVKTLMSNVIRYYAPDFKKAAGNQSNSVTMTKSQNIGLASLLGRKTTEFAAEEAYALRQFLVSSATQVHALALKAGGDLASAVDLVAFQKAVTVHKVIQEQATGVAANAGRLLQQFNMVSEPGVMQLKGLSDIMKGANIDDKLVSKIAALSDPAKINKFIEKGSRLKKYDNAIHELFVNSVLSGPITHAVNFTSNVFTLTMAPTKTFTEGLSAAAFGDFQKARTDLGASFAQLAGISEGIREATVLWKELGGIKAVLSPEMLKETHEVSRQFRQPALTAEQLGASGNLGRAIDFMGRFIRMPGNALGLEDAMFKAVHKRVEINSIAYRKSSSISDPELATSTYHNLRKNPDEGSFAMDQANIAAEYYTFTRELGKQGRLFSQLVSQPGIRYIIPFFRTPTNIFKMGIEYSPFGAASDVFKAFKSGKAADRDAAMAKMAMGTLIPMGMMSYLGESVSGRVDQRTSQGRFQAEHGVPPYSLKVGDKWVSYEKIEPLRSILGLLVNTKDSLQNMEMVDPETGAQNPLVKELISAVVAPFIQTSSDNYMLQEFGKINYLLDGLASGDLEGTSKALEDLVAATLVPNFLGQINQSMVDGKYRETDGLVQSMQRKIPMLSRTLPPRLTVWGDEQLVPEGLGPDIISPFKVRGVKVDETDNELIRLGVAIPKVGKTFRLFPTAPELDLTPDQIYQIKLMRGRGIDGESPIKPIIASIAATDMPDEYKKAKIEKILNTMTIHSRRALYGSSQELQDTLKHKILLQQGGN